MSKDLDFVTHAMRATQLLRYGAGALTDFSDQTLTVAKPEIWPKKQKIFDDRFSRHLGVDYFVCPEKVAYCRFPRWYFCPKCSTLRKLDDWLRDYRQTSKNPDDEMLRHMKCTHASCKGTPLIAAGIVVACEAGHIDDFPWEKWVHAKSHKPVCFRPDLRIYSTGADSLDGVRIKCKNCGAESTLQGAFGENAFEKNEQNPSDVDFSCTGFQPFNGTHVDCHLFPKALRRGASSVYYPTTVSSLVIPPYSSKIRAKVSSSEWFKNFVERIDDISSNTSMLDMFIDSISRETNIDKTDVRRILEEKIHESSASSESSDDTNYRLAEYEVLCGKYKTPPSTEDEFICHQIDASLYHIPQIKSVSLVEKVRIITASIGFSRVKPVSNQNSKNFVSVKEKNTRYYPAYETRGEGIFIELDQNLIQKWQNAHPEVIERAERLSRNYAASFSGNSKNEKITPTLILLHTFSHLLIRQLSFECGYSVSSLAERLYCSDASKGNSMAGVFIYTASGDSEGTLGGLIRQGEPDALPGTIKKAITSALYCSNDPVCANSTGQGREALNLSACHACTLLPETSCEKGNVFLDRLLVSGTLFNPNIGFFSDIRNLDISTNKPIHEKITNSWGTNQKAPVEANKKLEINYIVGEDFKSDFQNWSEAIGMFDGLNLESTKNIPLPTKYGGKFVVNGHHGIEIVFVWDALHTVLIDSEISADEKKAISDLGWNIIEIDENINTAIQKIQGAR